jgi:hypothetical protein
MKKQTELKKEVKKQTQDLQIWGGFPSRTKNQAKVSGAESPGG